MENEERDREKREEVTEKREESQKIKVPNCQKDKPEVIFSDTCFCHPFLFEENCSKSLLVKVGSEFVVLFLKLISRDYPLLLG